jgi:hypothetical protein
MTTITSLRPNMSREQLFRIVLPGGVAGRMRMLLSPVRGVADLYIPFDLFRVEIAHGTRRQTKHLAIDAVTSALDLYEVEADELQSMQVSTRNVVPKTSSAEQSERALLDKVRRMVFRKGFFALRDVSISAALVRTFYVPYWVVMVGGERDLNLRVFDAVRCRPEGAKIRSLVREWLTAA